MGRECSGLNDGGEGWACPLDDGDFHGRWGPWRTQRVTREPYSSVVSATDRAL